MGDIRAIETSYKGYRFRSRLEARWAVFLDALEVPYLYEHEGYKLPDGTCYLPDFYLPREDFYIEVKPDKYEQADLERMGLLVVGTGRELFIGGTFDWYPDGGGSNDFGHMVFYCEPDEDGEPPARDLGVFTAGRRPAGAGCDYGYYITLCVHCGRVAAIYEGREERLPCDCDPQANAYQMRAEWMPEKLRRAYEAAKSARFEHGATIPPVNQGVIDAEIRAALSERPPLGVDLRRIAATHGLNQAALMETMERIAARGMTWSGESVWVAKPTGAELLADLQGRAGGDE